MVSARTWTMSEGCAEAMAPARDISEGTSITFGVSGGAQVISKGSQRSLGT